MTYFLPFRGTSICIYTFLSDQLCLSPDVYVYFCTDTNIPLHVLVTHMNLGIDMCPVLETDMYDGSAPPPNSLCSHYMCRCRSARKRRGRPRWTPLGACPSVYQTPRPWDCMEMSDIHVHACFSKRSSSSYFFLFRYMTSMLFPFNDKM